MNSQARMLMGLSILASQIALAGDIPQPPKAIPIIRQAWTKGDAAPGQIVVEEQVRVASVSSILKRHAVKTTKIRRTPFSLWFAVAKTEGGAVQDSLKEKRIRSEPNYIYWAAEVPNDEGFIHQWALKNVGQEAGTIGADIDYEYLYSQAPAPAPFVIAVVDSGIDYKHPDLVDSLWVNPGEIPGDNLDNDGNGYRDDVHGINAITGTGDPADDNGHGTHVAGIIAASTNNMIGIAGAAPGAKILSCKFLNAEGLGTLDNALQCMKYIHALVERGERVLVMNNSWASPDDSFFLREALAELIQEHDMAVVAAAGNGGMDEVGDDIDEDPCFPAAYDVGLISVGATNRLDKLAEFSNFGKEHVHLVAPGVAILSTLPGGAYGYKSGTSMAAPYVAALVGWARAQGRLSSAAQFIPSIPVWADYEPDLTALIKSSARLSARSRRPQPN